MQRFPTTQDTPSSRASGVHALGPRSILVYERELTVSRSVAHCLAGFARVVVAHSAEQVLETLKSESVDIVVCAEQPAGHQLASLFRALQARWPWVRRLVVGETNAQHRALVHGTLECPLTPERLVEGLLRV